MGMVTHVLINNDMFGDIKLRPEGFVESIQGQMSVGGVTRLDAGERIGVGWCSFAHHSSYSMGYANNHTTLVGWWNLPSIEPLFSAWKDEGISPEYHREQKARLKREWPSLYNAVDRIVGGMI